MMSYEESILIFFKKLALSVPTPWALWRPCLFLPFHFMFNTPLYKPTFLIGETHWHLCVICSCRCLHVHKSKILGQNWFQWSNFWLAGVVGKGIHCERNGARHFINAIFLCRHLSGLLTCKDLSSQETDMRRNYLLTPLVVFFWSFKKLSFNSTCNLVLDSLTSFHTQGAILELPWLGSWARRVLVESTGR